MRKIAVRSFILTLVALVGLGMAARPAQATTITFDQTITSPLPPTADFPGFDLEYHTPPVPPGPADAFYTQGYGFGGRTQPVTPFFTQPEFTILLDPVLCALFAGAPCVDNGTDYLVLEEASSLIQPPVGAFSLYSFEASQVFGPTGPCDDCGSDATTLDVFGFFGGVQVAHQAFQLSFGFQTFTLTGPNWGTLGRVIFLPRDATGAYGLAAIDNINVSSVPEPASLLLLGTGIAGLAARRRAKGRAC